MKIASAQYVYTALREGEALNAQAAAIRARATELQPGEKTDNAIE
jgi:hypothetical protein